MKYEVGDHVRIKNLDWYNRHTNGTEIDCGGVPFTSGMKWFCSCVMTIRFVHADCYDMVEDSENYYTDEMIEGLVEEEMSLDEAGKETDFEYEGLAYTLPDGYIFKDENGDVINATKIVLEKKKKEYLKTYEECCKVLEIEGNSLLINTKHITDYERDLGNLMGQLHRLIICRDAYWKIAGEEMGLGKPWEPDWKNSEERRYSIVNIEGDINLPETILTKWILKVTNKILVFPTEEMRDAFYENFDPDIEFCKELL